MAGEAHTAEAAQMTGMPPMLAYTVYGSFTGDEPWITIGQGPNQHTISPGTPQDSSYWIVFLDANNPATKVHEFIVPGQNNTTVPSGLDQYMSNPDYLFAVVTETLSTFYVPQGDFYDYLVAHGAGRELQRLEQINTTLGCGRVNHMSYVLSGRCGPPPVLAYESSSITDRAMLLMSLMPLPSGQPPYSICDTYTFATR
jgi:hypothetical protein